ncbi:cytidine/deoxycytidylate deaminase family protein [Kineococcus sp. SYSU DK003]|uniref:cytidine deaminase n=1 Tax=Kineococcus sp. SYSU DK003 TaxID=3383124 RepID=UPI003D7E1CF9
MNTELPRGLHPDDADLWHAAVDVLARSYRTGRHEVAAALRTADGRVSTGLHVEGSAGRSSVCAEGVALGNVFSGADAAVVAVVAALHRPGPGGGLLRPIAPCGVCRELLVDHCPGARVYTHDAGGSAVAVELPGRPEDRRGFDPARATVPGSVTAWTALELMPGKNPRGW